MAAPAAACSVAGDDRGLRSPVLSADGTRCFSESPPETSHLQAHVSVDAESMTAASAAHNGRAPMPLRHSGQCRKIGGAGISICRRSGCVDSTIAWIISLVLALDPQHWQRLPDTTQKVTRRQWTAAMPSHGKNKYKAKLRQFLVHLFSYSSGHCLNPPSRISGSASSTVRSRYGS